MQVKIKKSHHFQINPGEVGEAIEHPTGFEVYFKELNITVWFEKDEVEEYVTPSN